MREDSRHGTEGKTVRVLVLFYSFSGQTSGLLHRLVAGLKQQGVRVWLEKLHPVVPLRFPVGTIAATFKMMSTTFLRLRVPIRELSPQCLEEYDLVILAGPTWSYNPSGPVLSLLDRDGPRLFKGRTVIPLISCRGYWRMHWYGLRRMLRRCGATVPNRMVFDHPHPEPWRTIGVFLKIAGRAPERSPFIGKYYRHFGHSKEQQQTAMLFGRRIGRALRQETPLSRLDLVSKGGPD